MSERKIVAECRECGQEYIYMNPAKDSFKCLRDGCEGIVYRLETPRPAANQFRGHTGVRE